MKAQKEKKPAGAGRKILKVILTAVLVLAVCAAALVGTLTVTEYRPAEKENLQVKERGEAQKSASAGQNYRIATWNIGYGALGDNADFFMDGGTMVNTADRARVDSNLDGIAKELENLDADWIFLQEVDRDSQRSHRRDEVQILEDALQESKTMEGMDSAFAWNFRVLFIPYPIPPIGPVNSGILTMSDTKIADAARIRLPCPFKWPVRTANLKRCLMENRIPVTDAEGNDTGKELVLINLHLEAYDSGEGKILQTQMLRQVLEEEAEKGNYVIAGGDFNQTFSGTDDSMYPEYEGTWHCGEIDESEFPDGFLFLMDNRVPTCRSLDQPYAGADQSSFQYYMIDGFIVSDNVSVNSIQTQDLGFACSDHNPVVMDFALN